MAPDPAPRPSPTLAEAAGLTPELGDAVAALAAAELAAGRLAEARTIAEGLAASNPRDARAWTVLARLHRREGRLLAARFCAEVACVLAPADPDARLARAEALLAQGDRASGQDLLAAIAGGEGASAGRARALLSALGGGGARSLP